jgi:membrane protein
MTVRASATDDDARPRRGTPAAPANVGPRGRGATTPEAIPTQGWKGILLRVGNRIGAANISVYASGVAFYAFLAIPSALTALVALYGLVFDPASVEQQVESMKGVVPQEALKLISDQLTAVTTNSHSNLSISFAVALLVALWGSRSAMSTMITALNIAYEEEERRGFIRFQAAALALTAAAIVFAVISIALIAVLPAIIGLLPLGDTGKTLAAVLRWPILLLLVVFGFAAIYHYAPCRREPRWLWISWGAVVATVLWLAGSALFSVYVGQFASYNKTYGSLGAVAVLLMWLYLSAFAVLLGAQLNAEMERQTERDTTEGKDKHMGRRAATVADQAMG